MKLIYVYHSGFVLEGKNFILVMDYYWDSREGNLGVVHDLLKDGTKRWYVLVSHHHPDHFNPEILQWKQKIADIHYIFSRDVRKKCGRKKEKESFF